jgi:hypothetical protein
MSDNEGFDLTIYNDDTEIETQPTEESKETVPVNDQVKDFDEELREDYHEARDNYREIVKVTKTAIDDLLMIAQQSEHPRAFEVLGQLLGNITATNDKLLDIHRKIAEIEYKKAQAQGKSSKVAGNTFIENAVFTGSLKDFQMKLKEMRQKQKEQDETTEDE